MKYNETRLKYSANCTTKTSLEFEETAPLDLEKTEVTFTHNGKTLSAIMHAAICKKLSEQY